MKIPIWEPCNQMPRATGLDWSSTIYARDIFISVICRTPAATATDKMSRWVWPEFDLFSPGPLWIKFLLPFPGPDTDQVKDACHPVWVLSFALLLGLAVQCSEAACSRTYFCGTSKPHRHSSSARCLDCDVSFISQKSIGIMPIVFPEKAPVNSQESWSQTASRR